MTTSWRRIPSSGELYRYRYQVVGMMCYQARIFIVSDGDASIAHVCTFNASITRCLLGNLPLSRRSLVSPSLVDRISRYFLGLYRLGMIEHLLPCTKNLTYWHGDYIAVSAMGSEEYKEVSKKRMNKLRDFPMSSHFVATLFKGAISSIPRWRYARDGEKGSQRRRWQRGRWRIHPSLMPSSPEGCGQRQDRFSGVSQEGIRRKGRIDRTPYQHRDTEGIS